ncbi:MAG: exodeoxyribonuclease VII large subunit [Akkermansiaceae bacterium]
MTRLVRRMKNLLEIEIGDVWVEGEISNLRRQASGHCYFTLKDEGAQISCVLFRGNAARAKAQPEDGMQARLFGEVSIYEARGQMQLIVKQVEDAGLGDLQAKFEALKKKLDGEGLFDSALKRPLPKFPKTVGLVTSPTGAALQDMLNILSRRAPWVQPVLYPVQVQGKGAEKAIAAAIRELGEPDEHDLPQVDVIITGRGGGSLEDLWNFNEEVVARAIHDCPIPVVSAVGHEIDFTISDFVADVRAPTPSAAAELVVPDATELGSKVASSAGALQRALENRLSYSQTVLTSARRALMPRDPERALREPIQKLDGFRQDLTVAAGNQLQEIQTRLKEAVALCTAHHPASIIQRKAERLDQTCSQIERAVESKQNQSLDRLKHLQSLLRTLGPEATFARGFSVTTDAQGAIIRDSANLKKGDILETQFAVGQVRSAVTDAKK